MFRKELLDGTVTYQDVDRTVCQDLNDEGTFHYGPVSQVIDKLFPISLPYMPFNKPYKVILADNFIIDTNNNKNVCILYIKEIRTPVGNILKNKYFKIIDKEIAEIKKKEYLKFKNMEKL